MIEALPADITVFDTGTYVSLRDVRIAAIDDGVPESARVVGRPGVPVVKAFDNITDHSLAQAGRPKGASDRIALPVSGDDPHRCRRRCHGFGARCDLTPVRPIIGWSWPPLLAVAAVLTACSSVKHLTCDDDVVR